MKKLIALTTLAPLPAFAHSGHDAALSGVAHYVFSPLHGLGVVALAGVVALLLRRADRRKDDA